MTASEVADAKFPMADSDFSNALLAVESASADFAKWRYESLSQLRLSVDANDLVASRAQLIRNSNHHRQRAAAGRLLDDLGHRVTTRYPLPVAYRWRRAVAALGGPEEINAVLHAQEVLLAYLAMMSLTFSRELGLGEGARCRAPLSLGMLVSLMVGTGFGRGGGLGVMGGGGRWGGVSRR